MFVYADNAATTKTSDVAINAMLPIYQEFYGNPSSLHTTGQAAKEKLEQARKTMAKYLNADHREITFTSGGSEANNQAILSGAAIGKRKGKMHIISSKFEHHAVLHTLEKLKSQGFEITLLDVYSNGIVKLEDVKNAIREDTALLTIMFANNEIGTIQPITEIGALCREKGVLFHTDAVQVAGHLPIEVKTMNIDLLSLSAHKFHGPKGVGVLFAKRGIRLENVINGGAQEHGKRPGTENLPAIVGMEAAFKDACENMVENAGKTIYLRDKLIRELSKIPHSIVNGDLSRRLPGNVNMCFEGIEGESLLLMLDKEGVQASSGSACTSGSLDPSHVLLSIGLPHEIAHGSLRLSLCQSNTESEIDHIIKVVPKAVEYLRNMSPVWESLERGEQKHFIDKKGA